jgi:hypothetical protein
MPIKNMKNLTLLLALFCVHQVYAQEIYKWKDSNGKVHFGDRAKAPSESKKMDIQLRQAPVPPPISTPEKPTKRSGEEHARPIAPHLVTPKHSPTAPLFPSPEADKKSIPVDPATVPPKCKTIIDEIENVPRGTPWTGLSKEFDRMCSGIAYECTTYQRAPENNKCGWVKRTGNTIIKKNIYQ